MMKKKNWTHEGPRKKRRREEKKKRKIKIAHVLRKRKGER
jgi:hypothetical protein